MADDDVLRSARLPDVSVDADLALARTVGRGRARRRRRLGALGVSAALVVFGVVAATLALSGRDEPDRVATGPTTVQEADGATTTTAVVEPEPEPGDVATWTIDGNVPPSPDKSRFTARVTRLGCNAGETGTVLRPGVVPATPRSWSRHGLSRRRCGDVPGNDAV